MMVIEMREAAQTKAFGLIDEIKDLDRKKKMIVCELEDTLYDCFGSSDEDDYENEPDEVNDEYEQEPMLGLRYRKSRYGMRKGMRHYRYDDDMKMRSYRSGMRMRRAA